MSIRKGKKNLLVGDKVMIFQKPLTEEEPEGKAIIKKLITKQGYFDGRSIWNCMVKFPEDRKHYERKVLG